MNDTLVADDRATTVTSGLPPQASSRLESLRGLASIQVAMFHSLLVLQTAPVVHTFVAEAVVLFNGRAAVTLFFVLSGLVLGMSLGRSTASFAYVFSAYTVRRFFRIYPAFFLAILVGCGVTYLCARLFEPTASIWVNGYFLHSISLKTLCRNLLFLDHSISNVTWTLKMEMICSLLLPFCYYGGLISRYIPWLILLASITISACFPPVVSLAVTQAFFIGYLIPSTYPLWHRISTTPAITIGFTLLGLVLLLYPRSLFLPLSLTTLIEASGGAILIGNILCGARIALFKILDQHLVKIVGRISYGYYLYQPLVLIFVSHLLLSHLIQITGHSYSLFSVAVLWTTSSLVAFPAAWLSYEWVEKPMILFAKSICPHSPPSRRTT